MGTCPHCESAEETHGVANGAYGELDFFRLSSVASPKRFACDGSGCSDASCDGHCSITMPIHGSDSSTCGLQLV